jgi:hypothetical protein
MRVWILPKELSLTALPTKGGICTPCMIFIKTALSILSDGSEEAMREHIAVLWFIKIF